MTSSLVRRALLAAFLAAASVSGCKCGSKVNTLGCNSDEECKVQFNGSDRAFCDSTKNPPICALHPKQCDTAADCCPAQVCNAQGHYCFDKYTPCTQDGTCPAQGQVCQQIGVFAQGLGCTFAKCDPTGACSEGTTCFNKYCVGEPPCNGGCKNPSSPVCVTATNLCSPAPKDPSCAQTCPTGKMLVLQDPSNIFDTCNLPAEKCECDALPPLQVRDVSRYSSIAANGQFVYVTAYDGDTRTVGGKPDGDLVIHTFDKSNLSKPVKTEWLDGVPATGHIGGDVTGPRGGITDPGPDVGQYTSIAASATGDLYVAYYDVDNGDLKFIARYGGPAASWTAPVTIDGSTVVGSAPSNGDVGMYASIALDKNGIPAIAYFRRGSYNPGTLAEDGPSTALVYAVAKRTQPLSKDDWTVVGDVEAATRPPPPCNDACTGTQICVADPNVPSGERCAEKSIALCNPTATPSGCTGNQSCVQDTDANHSPVCRTTEAAAALAELPQGTGLMPQLAFIDNDTCLDKAAGCAIIAYYDSLNKVAKAVQATHTGAAPAFGTPVEIDGHTDKDLAHPGQFIPSTRDTGRWPTLAVWPSANASGRIAIAFADLSAQQLLVYQSDTLIAHGDHVGDGQPGLIHVVEDGAWQQASGTPWHAQTLPGVQTSMQFTPSGKLALAYQDATPVDLVFSMYDPAQHKRVSRSVMRSTGAAGFWPRLAIVSDTAYVSSATIKAATVSIPFNQLFVDVKPAP